MERLARNPSTALKEGRIIQAQALVRWECIKKDASGYGISEDKAKEFLIHHYREAHPVNSIQHRVVKKTIHEYVIETPADAKEISLAIRQVYNALKSSSRKEYADYDDAFNVRTEDENIVFYWEEEED